MLDGLKGNGGIGSRVIGKLCLVAAIVLGPGAIFVNLKDSRYISSCTC